jgi:hypothetical protein
MPPVTVDELQRAVEAVAERRRAVERKERDLVASLNEALKGLGYAVVPVPGRPRAGAAPRARRRSRR